MRRADSTTDVKIHREQSLVMAATENGAEQGDLREQVVDAIGRHEGASHVDAVATEIRHAVDLDADLRAIHHAILHEYLPVVPRELRRHAREDRRARVDLDAAAIVTRGNAFGHEATQGRFIAQDEIVDAERTVDAIGSHACCELQLAALHSLVEIKERQERAALIGRDRHDRFAVARARRQPDDLRLA